MNNIFFARLLEIMFYHNPTSLAKELDMSTFQDIQLVRGGEMCDLRDGLFVFINFCKRWKTLYHECPYMADFDSGNGDKKKRPFSRGELIAFACLIVETGQLLIALTGLYL